MSTEIIKILDAICDKFGLAIDWTSQNVMPYVEQLCEHIIRYELISSSIYMVLLLIPIIALITFCIYEFKKASQCYDYCEAFDKQMYATLAMILSFLLILVFVFQLNDVITALTFPEKTIIEFISQYTQK